MNGKIKKTPLIAKTYLKGRIMITPNGALKKVTRANMRKSRDTCPFKKSMDIKGLI